jgi:hypothetical protein
MVKTRINSHAKTVRDAVNKAITDVFGRNLTLRVVTRTKDDFGQLSAVSTADTSFVGDLQFGLDLDQKYLSSGIVEVGDAVLYVHPLALSTLPQPQDQVIDGNSVWEVQDGIESPELGGDVTFYSYKCKRRVNTGDV